MDERGWYWSRVVVALASAVIAVLAIQQLVTTPDHRLGMSFVLIAQILLIARLLRGARRTTKDRPDSSTIPQRDPK